MNTINPVFFREKTCILKMNLEFSEGILSPGLFFFLPPGGTFNIADVAEFPCLNRNGDLHQKGEDKETCCPDAEGDHQL